MTGLHQIPNAGRLPDTASVRVKVEQDIEFLHARISTMEQHPRPNRIVMDTYKAMLSSRQSVLKWLLHGSSDGDINVTSKRSA